MILAGLLGGIINCLSLTNLLFAFLGCFLGTIVGVLPGLGPVSAVAILFPLTTYLPPDGMVIALAAIYYGAMYGGSTTAILMNIPGEVSSVPTALDGFALTRQGKAGAALAISAIVSFVAGIFGTVVLSLLGPPLSTLCLKFGPPEYFGLALFSLTAIAGLSGRSVSRGLIMAAVGMLMASVGVDVASSLPRLTFKTTFLLQGFDIVPVMIGLFGIGEVLKELEEGTSGIYQGKMGRLMPDRKELGSGMKAGFRATLIAFTLGLFPGMLPSITSFLCYSFERQRSKHPERFGRGAIEGVAAPEAANNAAAMAGFIPLLTLGIPTGPTMALILAALIVYGLVPGPTLFTEHAPFTWTIIGSFFVANFILLILNLPFVGLWAKIAAIPYKLLAPIILAICIPGAYSIRNNLFDVWVCLLFGLIGWFLSKRNWPVAPLVLGFILGPMAETSLRQSLAISPIIFIHRPIFFGFVVLTVFSVWVSSRLRKFV
ncbi:MAG: tripartite tricarboxylate transporter permease [Thermodesulfobacteriota bacterium]